MRNAQDGILTCPYCLGALVPDTTTGPRCARCGKPVYVWDGVALLAANPEFYYGEVPKAVMLDLLKECREVGVAAAVEAFAAAGMLEPYVINYALSSARAAFLLLLAPGTRKRVLDLGCGWGNISLGLAPYYREVYAADLTKERARFAALRAAEAGANNVIPVCAGDTQFLPFADDSFDCVILNGVLEWVPECRPGNPLTVQTAYLREAFRILNKDLGQIYIGIENRLSHLYFRGFPEDHTRLRFVSLLPRPIANVYSKFSRQRPYRTYTYSARGYKRLLRRAGLRASRFFLPLWDYRAIQGFVDLGHPLDLRAHLAEKRKGIRLFLAQRVAPVFYPSYSIVAQRKSPTSHVLEEVRAFAASLLGAPGAGSVAAKVEVSPYPIVVVRLRGQQRAIVAKVPLSPDALEHCLRDFKGLEVAGKALAGHPCERLLPEPVATQVHNDVPTFYQTCARGFRPERNQFPSDWYEQACNFLRVLHKRTLIECGAIPNGLRIENIENAAAQHRLLASAQIPVLARKHNALLSAAGASRSLTHGDFWPGNLLFDDAGNLSGVVDWGDSDRKGFPGTDFLNLVFYARNPTKYASFAELIHAMESGTSLSSQEKKALAGYWMDVLGRPLAEQEFVANVYVYLLQNVMRRAQRAAFSRRWAVANLGPLLQWAISIPF